MISYLNVMLQRARDESARKVDVAEGSHDPRLCPHLPNLHSQVALLRRYTLPGQGLYQVFLHQIAFYVLCLYHFVDKTI